MQPKVQTLKGLLLPRACLEIKLLAAPNVASIDQTPYSYGEVAVRKNRDACFVLSLSKAVWQYS